jgi:hypothetical protein
MEEVAMTVRSCLLAGWLGCLAGGVAAPRASAQDAVPGEPRRFNVDPAGPVSASNANQQLAEAVAGALSRNGQLRGYRIDVVVNGDVAELQGNVLDAGQRELAQLTARSVPGVGRVLERLTIGNIEVAAATQELVPNAPIMPPSFQNPGQVPFPPTPNHVGPQFGPQFGPPRGPQVGPIMPIPNNANPLDPTPVFHGQAGMMPNPQYQPPPMPPYAWPSYAPYNNYSRVAQPKLYSHSQWPFIGPMYPYPKVPLGWRRVTLEWQDGSWWYGREATSHDWWRVRYW